MGHMANHREDHPAYPTYEELDSGALLALLPELDRWHTRYMNELRSVTQSEADAPLQAAAVDERLGQARQAVMQRIDTAEPEDARAWQSVLSEVDRVASESLTLMSETQGAAAARARELSETLTDISRRRIVAMTVLIDRGVLPPTPGQ